MTPDSLMELPRNQPETPVATRGFLSLLGIIALAGLALRVLAARGDLWLDEVWTLLLLERARTLADIFIGIHHDNNHVLNSIWMWLIGPDAAPLVMRLPAIAYGGLAIVCAAIVGRRFSDRAAIIAAALIAAGYFFVLYGSEARGYSGMILAILVAYAAVLASFDEDATWRSSALFFAAVCLGTFSHLTMVEASAALCVTVFAISATRGEPLDRRMARFLKFAVLAAAASIPAIACFAYGAFFDDFRIGVMHPFRFEDLAAGLAGMARATLGFPAALGDLTVIAATAALAVAALALAPPQRRWFPALAIFGLPALHAALHVPSQYFPRFHLTAAIGLVLALSDGLAVLLLRQGAARGFGVVLLALLALGQGAQLRQFLIHGRGDYMAAVREMTANGAATYAADSDRNETRAVVGYDARRLGRSATMVAEADWCAAPPMWFIVVVQTSSTADPATEMAAGPANCSSRFQLARTFRAWGLSGVTWALYRTATQN